MYRNISNIQLLRIQSASGALSWIFILGRSIFAVAVIELTYQIQNHCRTMCGIDKFIFHSIAKKIVNINLLSLFFF